MRGVEGRDQSLEERRVDWTGRHFDPHLHRLAGIAHVGLSHEPDMVARNAVTLQGLGSVVFQIAIEFGNDRQIDRILMHDAGDDVVGAPINRQQSEGGEIARIWRHDAGRHAEEMHHRGRLRGAGAAERQQREFARIDAALDGHLADGVGLIPVGDLDDAVREFVRRSCCRAAALASAAMPSRARATLSAMPPPISAGGMRPSTRLASVMVGSLPPFG